MSVVHTFEESVRKSTMSDFEDFWLAAYREAFDYASAGKTEDGNTQAQKMGIDRTVVLKSGAVIRIDEKLRHTDYGDILLEYMSNDRTGAKGWIEKDLLIDYLAYGVYPSRKVYLFDFRALRRVWRYYSDRWIELAKADKRNGFRHIKAYNEGYATHSIAVPLATLRQKMSDCMVIDLSNKIQT